MSVMEMRCSLEGAVQIRERTIYGSEQTLAEQPLFETTAMHTACHSSSTC